VKGCVWRVVMPRAGLVREVVWRSVGVRRARRVDLVRASIVVMCCGGGFERKSDWRSGYGNCELSEVERNGADF
jgi:hypothetical protein